MNEEKDEIEFSYEAFDRQLDNFCRMLSILVDAWEDYSPQELTFDIRSLCTKATRLCYMAEKDMVLQHNDIAKQRKEQNETHEVSISRQLKVFLYLIEYRQMMFLQAFALVVSEKHLLNNFLVYLPYL